MKKIIFNKDIKCIVIYINMNCFCINKKLYLNNFIKNTLKFTKRNIQTINGIPNTLSTYLKGI